MPAHTISPARDRLQSRALLTLALPLLLCSAVLTVHTPNLRWPTPTLLSLAFGLLAWRLRAATPTAAVCGALICFILTAGTASPLHSALPPLILLFVLTFAATRAGRQRKAEHGLAESRKGRNGAQVIANLGIAALFASPWRARLLPIAALPVIAALAEATADTLSSEIGQAFGGTPRMLTTLRAVPPGTDGAITLTGTAAGLAGAAAIAAVAIPALGLTLTQAALAFAAATAGLLFDSILGATLERRGWINNDLVNLLSTAFSALLTLPAIPRIP